MNQYRCETCKYFKRAIGKGDVKGFCELKKPYLTLLDVSFSVIALKGCASHSDFQNQREKVLDDVIHEISQAAPEMEGKKLFITVLALCGRIDRFRGEQ